MSRYTRLAVRPKSAVFSAKPAAPGLNVRLQHGLDAIAERQIGEADDAGAAPRRPVSAARAHGGDAVDEFGLADRPQFGRTVSTVHRMHSTKTVPTTLWPLARSASKSGKKYR